PALRTVSLHDALPISPRALPLLVARLLLVVAIPGMLAAGCAEASPEKLSAAANAGDLENRTLDDARLRDFAVASLASTVEPGRRSEEHTSELQSRVDL